MRDIEKQPYSADEARIAKFFADAGTGGGDDPVGSLIACHQYAMAERNSFRAALTQIKTVAEDNRCDDKNSAVMALRFVQDVATKALSS